MTKVVMIVFNVYPDPRIRKEAVALANAGYDISVLAWKRNRLKNPVREKRFNVHYLGPELPDNFEGLQISAQGLIKSEALTRFSLDCCKLLMKIEPDIVHANDVDTLHIGVAYKKMRGAKLVYDAHEIWELMMHGQVPGGLGRAVGWAEKLMMKETDAVITVGATYASILRKRGVARNKINLVLNACDAVDEAYSKTDNEVPVISYIGGLKGVRQVHELAIAGSRTAGVSVQFAGDGPERTKIEALSRKSANVNYLGTVPMDTVPDRTRAADVAVCLADPSHPYARVGFPNRFFDAISVGRPVLASAGTYVGNLAAKLDCGVVVGPGGEDIKRGLEFIRDNPSRVEVMGRKALEAAHGKYNWAAQEQNLLRVYESMVGA